MKKKWIMINLALIALFGFLFVRDFLYNRPLKQAIAEFQQEAERLQQENAALSAQIDEFSSPQEVEKKIKRDLNLARPGESVIIFKETSTSTEPESSTGAEKDLEYYLFRSREALKSFWRLIQE